LRICQRGHPNSEPTTNPVSQQSAVESCIPDEDAELDEEDLEDDDSDDSDYEDDARPQVALVKPTESEQWASFVSQVEMIEDPLLISVFKHGQYKSFEPATGKLEVAFAKQFVFFQEWLADTEVQWKPLLDKAFGLSVTLNPFFTDDIAPVIMSVARRVVAAPVERPTSESVAPAVRNTTPYYNKQKSWQSAPMKSKRPAVDISDATLWPKATMIVRHFPGVVRLN